MDIIRRPTIHSTEVIERRIPTHSARAMRESLQTAACRLYGREGRDWRMVQDTTMVGGHVRALGACDGETLELR